MYLNSLFYMRYKKTVIRDSNFDYRFYVTVHLLTEYASRELDTDMRLRYFKVLVMGTQVISRMLYIVYL